MAIALEPCPFCRSRHLHIAHSGLDYCVVCQRCKSKGPHQESIEQAISQWNETSRCTETANREEEWAKAAQPLTHFSSARG